MPSLAAWATALAQLRDFPNRDKLLFRFGSLQQMLLCQAAERPSLAPLQLPCKSAICRTTAFVPASGIYEVRHAFHSLPQTVVLFKGEQFPKCSQCASPVTFAMVREVPALDYLNNLEIRIKLLELKPSKKMSN